MRESRPNIRRAKGITADTVRALLGLRHAGTNAAYLPLERIKLADQVKGSLPAPCIDPADVPACMRPHCDSYPEQLVSAPAARSFASKNIQAINGLERFRLTPSVPQSEPPRGCDDGARSAFRDPEPTAPSLPAAAEEPADAAADTEERRAGGKHDRAGQAGADQGGREGRTDGIDRAPRVVSRPARPGAAARPARPDAKRDAAAPELKVDRLAMIRQIAGQLDLRPATAQSAPVQARPIAAPRNPRKPAPVLRPDPIAERREMLDAATRYLKARCILVDCTDRSAMVRRYRVSGKREPMLAEEVIEHARDLGMGEQG